MDEIKYNFSGSDFRGAILNFESTVTQYLQSIPKIEQTKKDQLNEYIKELITALEELPEEMHKEAEAITKSTKQLFETATKDKSKKYLISVNGLKQAAEAVSEITPKILGITTNIIEFVNKLSKW